MNLPDLSQAALGPSYSKLANMRRNNKTSSVALCTLAILLSIIGAASAQADTHSGSVDTSDPDSSTHTGRPCTKKHCCEVMVSPTTAPLPCQMTWSFFSRPISLSDSHTSTAVQMTAHIVTMRCGTHINAGRGRMTFLLDDPEWTSKGTRQIPPVSPVTMQRSCCVLSGVDSPLS